MSQLDELVGKSWLHSHEEDSGDEMIFRPASFAFPPSRGRHGFALQSGGTAVLTGPDPSDRLSNKPATWQIEGGKRLVLQGPGEEARVLEIKSASPDKLVVKNSQ
jgi:hypothetical protein